MTNVPLNLFSSRWPSFFWEFGSTNQRIRRNSSQVVSYSEERKEWVFNAGKGSGRLRETSETLIFNNDNQKHHKERTFVTIICGPRSAEEVIPWEAGNFWAFAKGDAPEGNQAIHIWCNELKHREVDFEFQRWLNVLLREDQFVRPLPMWQTRRRKILWGDVVGWNFLKWKLSCLSHISTTSAVSSDFIVSKSLRHFQLTMSRLDWLCDPPFFSTWITNVLNDRLRHLAQFPTIYVARWDSSPCIECTPCWCSGATVDHTQFGQVWSLVLLMSFQDKPGTKPTNQINPEIRMQPRLN